MCAKLDVYCGMLGSGKTTLIRQMLKTAYEDRRVAIIENEIGQVNLDAEMLRQASVSVREVTSGCICCTMKGSLTEAIRILIEQEAPEYIVIEPSGAADLPSVLEAAAAAPDTVLNRVIMLVNGRKIKKLMMVAGDFLFSQIRGAQTAYLNFTEFMSTDEIAEAQQAVLEVNPELEIVTVPLKDIDSGTFPEGTNIPASSDQAGTASILNASGSSMESSRLQRIATVSSFNADADRKSAVLTSNSSAASGAQKIAAAGQRPAMTFFFEDSPADAVAAGLVELLKQPECRNISRIKGCLRKTDGQILKVDYVYSDWYYETLETFPPEKVGRLVFIGDRLPARWLQKELSAILHSL